MKMSLCVWVSILVVGSAALRAEDAVPKSVAHQLLNTASVKDNALTGSMNQTVTQYVTETKSEIRDCKA